MKRDLIIFTQRPGASTPKDLKRALDCRKLGRHPTEQTLPVPHRALVVNWGGSHYPTWGRRDVQYINNPEAVRRKTSKVGQIQRFAAAGVPTLEVTTERNAANGWLREGCRVLCREDGNFGGRGITVVEPSTALPPDGVDFFAKYFQKTHEFRFHVFKGAVIDVAQKKRRGPRDDARQGGQGDNPELHRKVVRSYDNGWIFAHNDLHLPGDSRTVMGNAAISAVASLGLDFGACDVLVRFSKRNPNQLLAFAVCEVNTAPGVECTETLNAYVDAITQTYEHHRTSAR